MVQSKVKVTLCYIFLRLVCNKHAIYACVVTRINCRGNSFSISLEKNDLNGRQKRTQIIEILKIIEHKIIINCLIATFFLINYH